MGTAPKAAIRGKNGRRILRIFEAFKAHWATPYPVELKWRKNLRDDEGNPCYGVCWVEGQKLFVYLDPVVVRHAFVAYHSLLDELAHVMQTSTARKEKHREDVHDDEWALWYGRLRRWVEQEDLW